MPERFQIYRLPAKDETYNGLLIPVDATAAKGARSIDYTQHDGTIVRAALHDITERSYQETIAEINRVNPLEYPAALVDCRTEPEPAELPSKAECFAAASLFLLNHRRTHVDALSQYAFAKVLRAGDYLDQQTKNEVEPTQAERLAEGRRQLAQAYQPIVRQQSPLDRTLTQRRAQAGHDSIIDPRD